MIRILTSLVAVLTVTSIQSQTSLSQLSKILSEGRIDELSGTCINEIFKHSLSLHYNTELYNGGFIATSYESNYDVVFAKNPFLFLLRNKEYKPTTSFVINNKDRLDYQLSGTLRSKQNNKVVESFFSSSKEIDFKILEKSITSDNILNNQYLRCLITDYSDVNNTNSLFCIRDIEFDTIFPLVSYDVSTVQRIRSPGFRLLL